MTRQQQSTPEDILRGRSIRMGHFNEGPSYSMKRPAGTRDWLIILTLSGEGYVSSNAYENHLSSGDLAMIAPNTPVAYGTRVEPGQWQLLWAHVQPGLFNGRWLAQGNQTMPGIRILPLSRERLRRQVTRNLETAYRFTQGPLSRGTDLARNAVEAALIWASMEAGESARHPPAEDDRVLAAREFIHNHFSDTITVKDVARAAGLSVSRCAEIFKTGTGRSIRQYIEDQRLSHAAEWLRLTPWPVQTVAERAGFDNPFYFSNRFRKRYGASPSGWRKGGG
ncbi:MAG: helix-turn-helix domain-containing protein [Opitutales bacterium]